MVMQHSMWPSHTAPYLRSLPRMLSHRLMCVSVTNGIRAPTENAPVHDTFKRKASLHVAYVGTNYCGLQIQMGPNPQRAIENVLHDAIYEAGMMLPTNRSDPHRLKWSRSSRTDRGVHSLGSVRMQSATPADDDTHRSSRACWKWSSMRLSLTRGDCPSQAPSTPTSQRTYVDIIAACQRALMLCRCCDWSPQIRVLSVQRVTNGFNARSMCTRRTYAYFLPMSILQPLKRDAPLCQAHDGAHCC